MKQTITILSMLISFNCISQDIDYAPHSISINIFSFFSPYHFNFNVSYERRISDKIAFEVGIAPIFKGDYNTSESGRISGSGIILRFEPKFFISNIQEIDTTRSIFVSTQFYTSYHKYKLKETTYKGKKSETKYSKIKNYAFGIVGQMGYHETGGQGFFEFSTGYGRKWVHTKNDNFIKSKSGLKDNQMFRHTIPGWNVEPAIGLNTKIGFNFR